MPWLKGYSLAGISKALWRLGIRRKRGRLKVHSPDLAYSLKLGWIEQAQTLASQQRDEVSLVYGDEFSLYRQPTLAAVYCTVGQEPTAALSHKGNTCYRYSGALDMYTGQVVYSQGAKMGTDGLCRFLEVLRAAYPQRLLFLVWDNWPVHQHPKVLARAAELEIHILWLPTYAPWTNYIEKLWRWLKQTILHHHRLADRWEELQQQVANFLKQFEGGSLELLRYVGLLPI